MARRKPLRRFPPEVLNDAEVRKGLGGVMPGRSCCRLTIQSPRRPWAADKMGNPGPFP
jgi:hypothetical protein